MFQKSFCLICMSYQKDPSKPLKILKFFDYLLNLFKGGDFFLLGHFTAITHLKIKRKLKLTYRYPTKTVYTKTYSAKHSFDLMISSLGYRYCRNEFQRIDALLICKLCWYLGVDSSELISYHKPEEKTNPEG